MPEQTASAPTTSAPDQQPEQTASAPTTSAPDQQPVTHTLESVVARMDAIQAAQNALVEAHKALFARIFGH